MIQNNIVTFVLGGGRGTRLYPLTKYRSKPAVPLGGKYRLIDIPLSNCINSGLRRIYVLTQFMSVSLHRHIRQTYNFDRFSGGFVELLAAQQTMDSGTDWYQGTADAVRKNLRYFDQPNVDYVLILSGDQLYHMDYRQMIQTHQSSGADVTIAAMPVAREAASQLGVMRLDTTGRVEGFLEKPQTNEEIDLVAMDPAWIDSQGIASHGRDCLASMGIYLFSRQTLVDALTKTDYEDFGREVFPASVRTRHVQAHLFDDYWEDIGTIRAFYEANLSLASNQPPFELAQPKSPIYTRSRALPASRIDGAQITGSLIADGCRIAQGAIIENSIIGLRSVIGPNAVIRNSVLMGADEYETASGSHADTGSRPEVLSEAAPDASTPMPATCPPLGIGANTVIENAIIDKNCRIGEDVRITNDSGHQDRDAIDGCVISEGIPVVTKGSVLPNGWKL